MDNKDIALALIVLIAVVGGFVLANPAPSEAPVSPSVSAHTDFDRDGATTKWNSIFTVYHDGHKWVVAVRKGGSGGLAIVHHPDCECKHDDGERGKYER